jgi:hypothetical protein
MEYVIDLVVHVEQVLCAASRQGDQLPQEEVRPHQPAQAQEEVRQQDLHVKNQGEPYVCCARLNKLCD